MASEIGYLIEHPDTSVAVKYLRTHEPEWTTDASKALRFFTQQDAADFATFVYEAVGPTNVAEHMWTGATPAELYQEGRKSGLQAAAKWCGAQASALHKLSRENEKREAFVEAHNAILKIDSEQSEGRK